MHLNLFVAFVEKAKKDYMLKNITGLTGEKKCVCIVCEKEALV